MPDLFTASGIDLPQLVVEPADWTSEPALMPGGRTASGRLQGARRSRPAPRFRIGPPRHLVPAAVLAFPLCRNSNAIRAMNERISGRYSKELASICDQEARKLEKRLIYRGVGKQSARRCAMDLLHEVYMKRVAEAERGT